MKILDGKKVAAEVRDQIKKEAQGYFNSRKTRPGLAVILVGDDPASQVYVGSKIKACQEVGFASFEHRLPADCDFASLKKLIEKLNKSSEVHGILVQLPLPKHLPEAEILALINPEKDTDCLTTLNLGSLFQGRQKIAPCTPSGVIEILKHYKYPLTGLNAVVVGRSQIVGLPMAQLLIQNNATVTVVHSKTHEFKKITAQADLVVAALGKPQFLTRDYFKKGAIVIDVGIHRMENNKLCGDVKIQELEDWVEACTPVPGGVGPMTIAMLLKNTLELYKHSQGVQ